jgi:hypothetical protein
MHAILALVMIGGIICGAHFVAAAIELAANRKKTKAEETAQAISDANQFRTVHKVQVVDQRHAPQEPHAFDARDFFPAGRR